MFFLGNLVLTEDKMHVKIAEFGIARQVYVEVACEAGSYRYLSLHKDIYREKKAYI